MDEFANRPRKIAIIGGGIAGLAAAHRATELAPHAEVTLFEASDRLGGILRTVRQDGFLIEQSADSFITNVPAAIDLCRRIGFADQLIPTNPENRGAMVVAHGKLERVPAGFVLLAPEQIGPVLRSPILSLRGKLRFLSERFVAARHSDEDESLAAFARRRYGDEVFQRLVQPLVGGIYTADPEKLSLAATLPRFQQMERAYGSLIRAARANRKQGTKRADGEAIVVSDSGARYSMFVAPREGLSSMVQAIAGRFTKICIRLNNQVKRVDHAGSKWRIQHSPIVQVGETSPGVAPSSKPPTGTVGLNSQSEFDAMIVATPAPIAATLLVNASPLLATELAAIEYAGSAIVVLGYERDQVSHLLDSFGFVVPAIENCRILSASFSSVKFPGRAPVGKVLIRVFLGGAMRGELLELDDGQLGRIAEEELRDLLGISGGPCLSQVYRWRASMPQYHLGHLARLKRINDCIANLPGLALAGNAYEGVGIPQCIRSGEQAAKRILSLSLDIKKSPGTAVPGL
jgi:protoporphyrinogen/coproporphyrinogen III oxidase